MCATSIMPPAVDYSSIIFFRLFSTTNLNTSSSFAIGFPPFSFSTWKKIISPFHGQHMDMRVHILCTRVMYLGTFDSDMMWYEIASYFFQEFLFQLSRAHTIPQYGCYILRYLGIWWCWCCFTNCCGKYCTAILH